MGVISYEEYKKKKKKQLDEEHEIWRLQQKNQKIKEENESQTKLLDKGQGSFGNKAAFTISDFILNATKGGIGAAEGVTDFVRRRTADVADFVGWDSKAKQLRKTANQNTTEGIASDLEHILYGDLSGSLSEDEVDSYDTLHKNSVLTDRSRGIAQSVGYSVTNAAMSTAMGGGNIGSLILTGVSAGGSAESRAIEQGMDADDAFIYGILSGSGEAVSEAFFGGVGKFTKALGYGKGALDDVLIENVTKRIGSNVLRSLTSFGLRAGGEGFEEILSAAFDTAAQKISGMDERSLKEIWQDQNVGQAFVDGVISSMFSSSPRLVSSIATGTNYDNGTTKNEQKVIEDIIDQRTQGQKLSNKERGNLRQQITKDLIEGRIAGSEIDKALQNTETTWNQNKDRYITRTIINENTKFTTTDDDLKIDKKQLNKNANLEDVQNKIKVLEQDFLNANNDIRNTTSSHELFDEMKRMIVATGEQQRLTSNKQMAEDGDLKLLTNKKGEPIRNGRGELQYVKADTGQLVTINGYHTKDGMVLNADTHQAFESTMGHELGESLKANTPEIYKQLRDLAVEVGKADGTLTKETFDAIKSTYGELGTNTDNYLDEYVNDKIGEMFKSDSNMFQEIGKKPSIARRLLNEIKYLIQKFTAGSPEQKRLLEAQHNLEKLLKQSVRELNVNKEDGNEKVAYSIETMQDGTKYVKNEMSNLENDLSQKDVFNILKGTEYTFEDGDTAYIIGNLKSNNKNTKDKNMYNELFKRYPKYFNNIDDLKDFNKLVNYNTDELLNSSKKVQSEIEDINQKHQDWNIKNFDTRQSILYDDSNDKAYIIDFSVANLSDGRKIAYAKKYVEANDDILSKIKSDNRVKTTQLSLSSDNNISQNQEDVNSKSDVENSKIQGLEVYSQQEIKDIANNYIHQKLIDNGIGDVEIVDSAIHGSRGRGTARADSDLDLVVQYKGEIREDDLFNALNDNGEDNLYIEGIKVDINPIQEDLSSYMERSNQYDEEIKNKNIAEFKQKQNDIIQKNNPLDTSLGEHTWINSADDIKTYQEALDYDEYENGDLTPDFTESMVKNALDTGKIMVYSSYPIKQGTFVTPSKMEAQSYAGNVQVYSKEVKLNDVAWIDSLQGQYANIESNVKYSLTDNQGRQLSEQQQEYFKDSVVRTPDGSLRVMYRGGGQDINIFDRNKANPNGGQGNGFYFTISKDHASQYGDAKEYYLNITNPLRYTFNSREKNISKEQLHDLIENMYNNEDFSMENYGRDMTVDNLTDEIYQKDSDYDMLYDLNNSAVGNMAEFVEYVNDTIGTNYDGIMTDYETVVLNSNQIKNVDNQNPTSNPDIRYSLSPSGEMQDSNGIKVTLETSDTGTTGTLMALHNLGEEKFNGILDLDGIPVPSIAVTNPKIVNHNDFGDGTLLFDKSTIDPAVEANEVYDRDVWSPTIRDNVQIDYEINDDAIENAANNLGIEEWRLRDAVEDNSKPEYLIERLLREEKLIDKYVADNNIEYQTTYKDAETKVDMHQRGEKLRKFIIDNDFDFRKLYKDSKLQQEYFDLIKDYYDNSTFPPAVKENLYNEKITQLKDYIDFQKGAGDLEPVRQLKRYQDDFDLIKSGENKVIDEWQTEKNKKQAAIDNGIEDYLREQTKDVYGEKGIRNDVETFTNSGSRRSFWALHDEYNLDNLVEALTKGETTGTQHWGSGYGQIQATMANRFNSISDIKSSEGLLTDLSENNEEMEIARENIENDIDEIVTRNNTDYGIVSELLVDFARGDMTVDNFKKLTRDYYQTTQNVPDDLIQKTINDMEALKNLPTDYFEAKPQRAVGLDEIQMAVIPNNWSEQTKQRLQDKGIKYTEYDPNVEGDRQRVINQFDELKFSLSNPDDIAPFGEGIKSEQIKPRDIQQTIQNSVQEAIAPIREQIQQIADEVVKSENLDDIELNLEPFMDIINGDNGQVLSNINKNYDQIMTNLQEQGLPKDAAQNFLQNMVHKYDQEFNRRKVQMSESKRNKLQKMILDAQEKFTNRNAYVDRLAKDSGNQMIKYKGDIANNSFGEAQYNVQTAQTDLQGNEIGKSVNKIFEQAKKQKLDAAFEDYLFNQSNIERHAVGKGSQVPANVSEQLVRDYESQFPQFKAWAKDIETYYDNLLTQEVNSGLIDQDTFNLLRGEQGIYRSYVPFFPSESEQRYFDDAGNLRPIKPLKRAQGGAKKIMGIQDAMNKQTMAVWNSMRTNQLYQEILNTVGSEEGLGFIVRNDPSNLSQSLYTDQDGNKFLTAYVNGEERSTKISDDLYNELSRKSENAIKDLEDKYSLLTKPVQGLSKLRRNILTSYNPIFALYKNPVKDIQDAVLYSKHTAQMLKELPSSYGQLLTNKTKEAKQFRALYGSGEYTGFGKGYAAISEMIELAPRFAEFKASLKAGESVEQAIYNARDITTNFGRGGYVTKAMNRNGFTFLNASVQGFSKFYRNFAEQPNAGQFAMAVGKAALLGIVPAVFNELAFGGGDDKDEEYEAQPDYIKDNYYLFKKGDGEFIRIPKGRALSVIGSAARRTLERIEGEEDAFDGYLKNAWSQIGPVEIAANPLDNTIVAPIAQVLGGEKGTGGNTAGRAWYGGDIVPYRLQGERPEDQSDASVDKMSIWLGEKLGISPYKINYVIDQYSGGLGDVILPMMTEETNSGAETPLEYAIAPIKDQIVVNSIDDNKYASEFYSTKEKLYTGSKATDKELLKAQYMNDVSYDLSALYKEKRAIQSDSSLGKKEKYEKVQQVQKQINDIAKAGLELSDKITVQGNYADVGEDRGYYKNTKGKWTAISQDDMVTIESLGLTDSEKSAYFDVKNQIYNLDNDYRTKKEGKSEAESLQIGIQQKKDRIETIKSSTLPDSAKYAMFDTKYDDKLLPYYEDLGFIANDILDYKQQVFTADKDKNGKTITNSKKKKVIDYINNSNMPYEQKLILYKKEYKSDKSYDSTIFNYINNSNLDYTSKTKILDELGIKYR